MSIHDSIHSYNSYGHSFKLVHLNPDTWLAGCQPASLKPPRVGGCSVGCECVSGLEFMLHTH
jgi:hypothetical protein